MPKDTIDWSQIKNWWPILTALVVITAFLVGISYQVQQNNANLKEFIAEYRQNRKEDEQLEREKYVSIENRLGRNSTNLSLLETAHPFIKFVH